MSMPSWLQQLLVQTGQMTEDGISRRARTRYCRGCGMPVLRGLDAEWCAMDVAADLSPLDEHGELAALVAGRATFELSVDQRARYQLDRRTAAHIAGHPPSSLPFSTIHAEHVCGAPLLPVSTIDRGGWSATTTEESDDRPPF